MAKLTPDATRTEHGLVINEKIIPWGAVWPKDSGAYKKGAQYKADRLLSGGTGKVKGVTIHNTNDLKNVEEDAEQYTRATWPNANMNDARVHYYVDDINAWQNLREDEVGWHAGDGRKATGGNETTLSMQMDGFLTLKGGNVELVGAPETIFVLPIGHVVSSKGEFDVDDESYKAMKAQIAKRGVDLVVDYEHQTLKGCEAPAAGWVKELKLEDGQIKAVVEWTPRGARYLENKEYRYLSPVVNVRKADNKAVGLHSLALTNTPAIEGMNPIVNSDNFEGGQHSMDIKKLAELLGLSEDATEEQVVEALKACLAENRSLKETEKQPPENVVANKAVCELLGLKAGAAAEDVTAKIMELKSGTVDGVNLAEELKALKQQNAEREANDAVILALKAGKITPAQKEWAKSYALSDPKGFGSFVEKAPQIVPMDKIELDDVKALKSDALDADTLLVCKQLGISPDDVKKYGMKED